ncbi:MAG TPA: GAF domain-containing protein [Thermomicrobiales bacterium]|nr:GAF domain-containing protein [Thermomicrobiales bacterium]
MTTDHSKITFLPTADVNRIFSRDEEAGVTPLPFPTAIARVAHAVSSDTSFDDLLHEIVVSASRAIDADIGMIRAISSDGANFVVMAANGPAPLSIGGLIGSYSVISEDVSAATPGSTITIDLRSEAQVARLPSNERWDFEHIGGRFLLIVPLFARGRLVGRLDLVRTANGPFSMESRNLVLPFAAYAAGTLLDQQHHRASEESQVFQTVIRLHESVEQLADPETILQAVVELIVREPGCARCYAMLWNIERGEFVPTAVAGLEPHLVDILKLISLSPQVVPAFDQMVHSSRPLVIADATKSTLLPASLVRALGIRAAMIVPLRGRRHQTTGVLLLDQNEEGIQFTDSQVTVMAGMAQHLSTLIENAILFDEIRGNSDSMSIINEIAIQMAMLTDEDSLFRQLYYQVASVLDAGRFGMALLTPDRRALDMRAAIDGIVSEGTTRMPLGDDPLSSVSASGRVELVGIRSGADNREWLPGVVPEDPPHSHLTVPITVGRNVIGALSIQSPFRNAYSPRDRELLLAVALHTGIAIENARLYRIVQSRGDRRAAVLDEVMQRQELERKELVDDIHDHTLQTLAACLYRLDQAQSTVSMLSEHEGALVQINDVRESLSENIDRLRRRIFELRPATLDRLGLEPALRELLSGIGQDLDLMADLDTDLPTRLAPEQETLVYRLVQEALDYIIARDGVSSIDVSMREHGDNILIAIHDDADYRADTTTESAEGVPDIGLLALIERADLAGGHLRVSRRSAGGSMMEITLPGAPRDEDVAPDPNTNLSLVEAAMEGGRDAGD